MRPHIGIHRTQVGKLLPPVSRHFIDHWRFAMYHFIVTKRKHEVFVVKIHHTEGKFILMMWTKERIDLEIIQGVVHPAHHPFHSKTQSTHESRFGNSWPVGCFFSDGLCVWEIP